MHFYKEKLLCGRQNNSSPRLSRKMSITVASDGIKMANPPTLKLADYPELFRWVQGDQRVFKVGERCRGKEPGREM